MLADASGAALLGPGGLVAVGVYLVALVGVGIAGRMAREQDSLNDFYLGGRNLGFFVLLLTLYATQYSGLTFVGFVGQSYRQGYGFLQAIPFTMSIVGAYFVIAPRLYRLSGSRGYITPGDFVQDRYESSLLTVLTTLVFIFALASYILANLKAMGYVVQEATGGRVSMAQAIILLSLLMVVYETLGGMRGVAWTDVIQGTILLLGCVVIFFAIAYHYGGPSTIAGILQTERPEFWRPPDLNAKCKWLSTLVLVATGVSIYPHAVQRIYAAKSRRALRRSLQVMIFMPLVTMLPMIYIGWVGAAYFPGLGKSDSEKVLPMVLNELFEIYPVFQFLLVLLVAAIIAAIMSTVDSALLAISSLFTQDFYRRVLPAAPQNRLTRVGKCFSWVLMGVMAYLAIRLRQTLWRLTEIKLEVLCQAAPTMFLGLHWARVGAKSIVAGLVVGLIVTLTLLFGQDLGVSVSGRPWGVHAGIWALAANVLVVRVHSIFVSRQLTRRSQESA